MSGLDNYEYCVLDVETTVNNTIGNNKGSAFCPLNKIILCGIKLNGNIPIISSAPTLSGTNRLYVGHNIGFDFHHCMVASERWRENIHKSSVWDTQLAEYLLTGQQHSFATLDELSKKYGGKLKDERIKIMWESGMKTEEIPSDMLEEYLREDLSNTEIVFLAQITIAEKVGMLPLILSQMEAKMACIEMEYNGMKIDSNDLRIRKTAMESSLIGVRTKLELAAKGCLWPTYIEPFDPNKRSHVSKMLFGGVFKLKSKEADGFYLNGNPKFKTVEKDVPFTGLGYSHEGVKLGMDGVYETTEKVIRHLHIKYLAPNFTNDLLKHRLLSKEYSTYVCGIDDRIYRDGCIHPNLNQVVTKTGRLSSSDPNVQNIASSSIKEVFVPRNKGGVIIDADYGQLEIFALAYLSKDKQLINDLNAGIDIHSELYQEMYGRIPEPDERKAFKRLSFGLIYGAGTKTLAENAGVSVEVATQFKIFFYSRYEGVQTYHKQVMENARELSVLSTRKTVSGMPSREYYQKTETGRLLVYKQYDSAYIKNGVAFSPTELKNYPVQSFATGDIVPLVLGKMYRTIKNHPVLHDKLLMINTVHDSLVFDLSDKAYLSDSIDLIKSVMEQAPKFLQETFGIELGLKLTTTISVGPNWYKIDEYNKEAFIGD